MAVEIERKFLVVGSQWRQLSSGNRYCQGYFPSNHNCTVRIRIIGEQGYLTIKGKTVGYRRSEFEYAIPLADAEAMLEQFCDRPFIDKTRYKILIGDLLWEVDEFHGDNEGLIVAEVELKTETQKITLPDWIGAEVTGDPRYYNANLVKMPYRQWTH